jgi:hypothetical protein
MHGGPANLPSTGRRIISVAERPKLDVLAGDATTPAVKRHLHTLPARFERLAEGIDEVASVMRPLTPPPARTPAQRSCRMPYSISRRGVGGARQPMKQAMKQATCGMRADAHRTHLP